jgi:hypothetical protein
VLGIVTVSAQIQSRLISKKLLIWQDLSTIELTRVCKK